VDEVRSSIFFTEEFVGHYSFKKLITEQMRTQERRMYQTRDALRWLGQLAEALDYLHTQAPPYIHGDVKCDNVFMNDGMLSKVNVKLADLKPHRHIFERAVHASQRRSATRLRPQQGQSTLARFSARHSLDMSSRLEKLQVQQVQQREQQREQGQQQQQQQQAPAEPEGSTPGSGAKGAPPSGSSAEELRLSMQLPEAVRLKLSNMSVAVHASAAGGAASAAPATPAVPTPAQPALGDRRASASAPAADSVLAEAAAGARSQATAGMPLLSLSVPSYPGEAQQQPAPGGLANGAAAGAAAAAAGSSSSGATAPLSPSHDSKPPAAPKPPAPRPKGAQSSAFAAATAAAAAEAAANGGAAPAASQSIAIPSARAPVSESMPIPIKGRQQGGGGAGVSSSFCAEMLLGSQEEVVLDLPVR
jgi:hypothetical protein